MLWFVILVVVAVLACVAWSFKGFNETVDVHGKSVFISGCEYDISPSPFLTTHVWALLWLHTRSQDQTNREVLHLCYRSCAKQEQNSVFYFVFYFIF